MNLYVIGGDGVGFSVSSWRFGALMFFWLLDLDDPSRLKRTKNSSFQKPREPLVRLSSVSLAL